MCSCVIDAISSMGEIDLRCVYIYIYISSVILVVLQISLSLK